MTTEIGMAIGQEVGPRVELFSVGGSRERSLQLSEELSAAGVTVTNAPKGLFKDFTRAADNDAVYTKPAIEAAHELIYAKPTVEAVNEPLYVQPARTIGLR